MSADRPSRPRSSAARRQRTVSRWLHVLAAAAIGTFVYAPADLVGPVRVVVQVVVVPLAAVSGLYLWKQAAVRRWLSRPAR